MTKELSLNSLFSYAGSSGNKPNAISSPVDICTDLDGNVLVINSEDDKVHLLDPKGKFLKIIKSAEMD